jgi:hypothetical protein
MMLSMKCLCVVSGQRTASQRGISQAERRSQVGAECGYAAAALTYTDIITEASVKVGAPATAAHPSGQKPPPIS